MNCPAVEHYRTAVKALSINDLYTEEVRLVKERARLILHPQFAGACDVIDTKLVVIDEEINSRATN